MKRLVGGLALVLCLTACGGPSAPAASESASTDAVQSCPARTAQSEVILDELPVGFEQTTMIGWCDFDRDGAEEEYKIMIQMDDEAGCGTCRVSIGGDVVTGDAFAMEEKPYLASLDGENVQLVLFDRGMSDDPMTHVFEWDGAAVRHAGTIYAAPDDIKLENGVITAPERWDVLQNAWFDLQYKLENGGIVRQKDPNKWYDYIGETDLKVLADLQLFASPDLSDSASFAVAAGDRVKITGVMLDREIENPSAGDMPMYWMRLRAEDSGKTGYLLANGYQCRPAGSAPVIAEDLFGGLIYAG